MSQVTINIPHSASNNINDLKKAMNFLVHNEGYLHELIEEIGLNNAILENNKDPKNHHDISVLEKEYADFLPQ